MVPNRGKSKKKALPLNKEADYFSKVELIENGSYGSLQGTQFVCDAMLRLFTVRHETDIEKSLKNDIEKALYVVVGSPEETSRLLAHHCFNHLDLNLSHIFYFHQAPTQK
nr:hypothetical protein [Tanacetum cinerariifolium]